MTPGRCEPLGRPVPSYSHDEASVTTNGTSMPYPRYEEPTSSLGGQFAGVNDRSHR